MVKNQDFFYLYNVFISFLNVILISFRFLQMLLVINSWQNKYP